jgi:hypothetical protein
MFSQILFSLDADSHGFYRLRLGQGNGQDVILKIHPGFFRQAGDSVQTGA